METAAHLESILVTLWLKEKNEKGNNLVRTFTFENFFVSGQKAVRVPIIVEKRLRN